MRRCGGERASVGGRCAYALTPDDATGSNWRRAAVMWGNGRGNHQDNVQRSVRKEDIYPRKTNGELTMNPIEEQLIIRRIGDEMRASSMGSPCCTRA